MPVPKGTRVGGRQRGTKNRRTVEREQAQADAAERITAAIPDAFEGDAHALLVAVYKDPQHDWHLRVDAAKGAIGYEKPKLNAVDANIKGTMQVSGALTWQPPQ
jgi:hypothetical protein